MTYSDKLRDPRWQEKRKRILARDNYECQLCNNKDISMHVHHLQYYGEPWDVSDDDLITYCEDCHYLVSNTEFEVLKVIKPKNVLPLYHKQFYVLYNSFSKGNFIALIRRDCISGKYDYVDIIPELDFHSITTLIKLADAENQDNKARTLE
jgi:hypothetical protein